MLTSEDVGSSETFSQFLCAASFSLAAEETSGGRKVFLTLGSVVRSTTLFVALAADISYQIFEDVFV
jgi:hypothetical protein